MGGYASQALQLARTREFNVSVNSRKLWLSITISPIKHNFSAFFTNTFLLAYKFWINSIKQTNP